MSDFSRLPRSEDEWRVLVEDLSVADDGVERHYLELKEELRLGDKKDSEKVAKFVLAAANRPTDVAPQGFAGHAVLVVGARGLLGVPAVEALILARAVAPFLPVDGPKWDQLRIPTGSGREVVIVAVSPPSPGDRIYACRKDGATLVNGGVYVRGDGETRVANYDDVERLNARAAGTRAHVRVSVDRGLSRSPRAEPLVDVFVHRVTATLLAALEAPRGPGGYWGAAGDAGMLLGDLGQAARAIETRSEADYRREVSQWGDLVREGAAAGVEKLLASKAPCLVLTLDNLSETYLEDVEVNMRLPGHVFTLTSTAADVWPPRRPDSWGSPARGHHFPSFAPSQLTDLTSALQLPPRRERWRFDPGVREAMVSVRIPELRPMGSVTVCTDLRLAVDSGQPAPRAATWTLTARGRDALISGECPVGVADEAEALNLVAAHLEGL